MAVPSRDVIINAVLAAAAGRPVPTAKSLQLQMPSLASSPASRTSTMALPPGVSETVFSIRVPKQSVKKHNVMRFNNAHSIDFSNWKVAQMEREDNSKQFKPLKSVKEALPKFGAGSEFGRDKREAARRRKYGMYRKKYKPQDQPWLLKIKETLTKKSANITVKPGQAPPSAANASTPQIQQRKFKGTIEGGFKDNSSYYVFEQKANGIIEAYPVHQWINFTPIQTYKALSAEEAEEEFGRRNKNLNLFTLMAKKRWKLQNDDGDDEDGKGEGGGKSKRDPKSLKMSEMDDWDDDDEDDDGGSDEGGDDGDRKSKKGKGKGKQAPKKKKQKGSDDEPLEDSDDGDEEGLELDYISDSSDPSEDEDDKKPELAGVDQEKSGLLDSDSSDEENADKKKAGRNAERDDKKAKKDDEEGEEDKSKKLSKEKHKKKDKHKKKMARETDGDGAGSNFNMPDLNNDDRKLSRDAPGPSSGGTDGVDASSSGKIREEASSKRKAPGDFDTESSSKRAKLVEVDPALLQAAASEGITEEAVRKYLLRKPMTVAELLQKFKQKQHKISNEDMVPIIAHLLKKINPSKQKSQTSKLYFSLKSK